MKTSIPFLLIAFLFLACTGGSGDPVQPEPSAPPPPAPVNSTAAPSEGSAPPAAGSLKVFVDSGEGYRISYPSDWALNDRSGDARMIRADLSFGRNTGLQIRVYRGAASDLEAYMDSYLEGFRRDMEGHWGGKMEEVGRDCGRIGDNPGCKAGLTFERSDGTAWYFVEYLIAGDGRVVILQCGTTLEDRYRDGPTLDEIAESLEFLDR